MALASYPGFFMTSPPSGESQIGVYWPALVPAEDVDHRVVVGEEAIAIAPTPVPRSFANPAGARPPAGAVPGGPTRDVPLGTICGARSGDKGGNANVGVWARNAAGYAWLEQTLTVDAFKLLVPEAATLHVERHALPNLWSLNFVVHGLLGDGVAASTRSDAQAKSFGEFLRARLVDIPRKLLAQ